MRLAICFAAFMFMDAINPAKWNQLEDEYFLFFLLFTIAMFLFDAVDLTKVLIDLFAPRKPNAR